MIFHQLDGRRDLRGGKRDGSGRPASNSVLVTCRLPADTYSLLVRLARAKFGKQQRGRPWIGAVIVERFSGVHVEDSAAVRLAREAGLLPPARS